MRFQAKHRGLRLLLCALALALSLSGLSPVAILAKETEVITLATVPQYSGSPYVELLGNVPEFDESDLTTTSFETYSELDELGRCGIAYANIGVDLMPTEERGQIGSVRPTGWHTVKYEGIDGNYLYNRCHLIAYELAAENANEQNLITGTRYLNVEGMLPFENEVTTYVKQTGNHVLYRVTPIFEGDNLVASGVQMEALSVEDAGEGICFNIYCYNVQPGIEIDYATGESCEADTATATVDTTDTSTADTATADTSDTTTDTADTATADTATADTSDTTTDTADTATADTADTTADESAITYILNTNTMKFHYPTCSSVSQMSEKNRQETSGSREEILAQGYEACKRCNP